MFNIRILTLLLCISSAVSAEQQPIINLQTESKQQWPKATEIIIEKDPVYKTKKKYLAYPLTDFVQRLTKETPLHLNNSVLIFTALDGYKVTMSYEDAMLEKGYIAFKDLAAKTKSWIEFKFGHKYITPAPYYLVWPDSKLDKWRYPSPFQLASISLASADSYFAAAAPVSTDKQASRGFSLFSRYCIRCHSVNHTGGNLGPELNVPKNITDFYSPQKLTDFILDAPSFINNTKMPVFKNVISIQDALAIQHYLKSMKSDPAK